jgi:hypothetical protein
VGAKVARSLTVAKSVKIVRSLKVAWPLKVSRSLKVAKSLKVARSLKAERPVKVERPLMVERPVKVARALKLTGYLRIARPLRVEGPPGLGCDQEAERKLKAVKALMLAMLMVEFFVLTLRMHLDMFEATVQTILELLVLASQYRQTLHSLQSVFLIYHYNKVGTNFVKN